MREFVRTPTPLTKPARQPPRRNWRKAMLVSVQERRSGRCLEARGTTLVVVATNVSFTKTELTKIAMMASTGAARAINPYHTNGDGDSTFAVSTNRISSDLGISVIGALAADLVSETVVRAVTRSKSVEGWVAVRDRK